MKHKVESRLIAYDIKDPKRLGQIFRLLKARSLTLQYSVFLQVNAGEKDRAEVEALIRNIISDQEDDIRIYPLPTDCFALRIGRPFLGESLHIEQVWMGEFLKKSGLMIETGAESGSGEAMNAR